MIHSYRDLMVWQKSIELVIEVYNLTNSFPREELSGLVSQMRRASVSTPSNIAEGKLRGHDKECRQFFLISFGSGGELETQIEIAKRLYKERLSSFNNVDTLLTEIMKMLNKLISDLGPTA